MIRKILSFVLVLALTVSFLSACGAMSDDAPAIRAGETSVSLKEFRYQYNNSIDLFKKKYADRIASTKEIDFSKSLDDQMQDEKNNVSWADYFANYTVGSLKNYCLLAEDARVNGMTLSENDISMIDDQIEYVKSYMDQTGMTEGDFFGEGMTIDDYRLSLERNLLGSNRYYAYLDSLDISYDMSAEYAKTKPETYLTLSYYYYNFSAANYNASYNEARTAAENFANSITNVDDFEQRLYDNILTDAEKEAYTEGSYYVSGLYHSYLERDLQTWGYEAGRKAGDYTLVTGSDGILLYVFAGLDLPSYLSYDLRLIFVPTDSNVGGSAGVKQAQTDAEAIVSEWENGGKGEELFSSLATQYSKDSNTFKNGGLSENTIISGLGDGSFDWITSEERAYGDVSVFTSTEGAFILFYIGEGMPTWQVQAENALKAVEFNEYIEEIADKYNFTSYEKVINRVK